MNLSFSFKTDFEILI